jgi:hypothetical protein
MSKFRVTIKGGRNEVEYTILNDSHDDTAVLATKEALETYRRHGHSSFPYNRGELTVKVEEVQHGASD